MMQLPPSSTKPSQLIRSRLARSTAFSIILSAGLCVTPGIGAPSTPEPPLDESGTTDTERQDVLPPLEIERRAAALADRQDELSMRIQDLSWKWASQEIVVFLEEIDFALLDARDLLEDGDVGGGTIAAQNDAIEKIYQAAKKNQQQQQSDGSQKPSPLGAMMDQLDYMTGKKPGSKKGKGGKGGENPGEGGGDGSETDGIKPDVDATMEMVESRTVPKGGGVSPALIPPEYRDGMEALRDELAQSETP